MSTPLLRFRLSTSRIIPPSFVTVLRQKLEYPRTCFALNLYKITNLYYRRNSALFPLRLLIKCSYELYLLLASRLDSKVLTWLSSNAAQEADTLSAFLPVASLTEDLKSIKKGLQIFHSIQNLTKRADARHEIKKLLAGYEEILHLKKKTLTVAVRRVCQILRSHRHLNNFILYIDYILMQFCINIYENQFKLHTFF